MRGFEYCVQSKKVPRTFRVRGTLFSMLMDEREQVLAVEREWTDAHLRGDVATIARLMADEYLKINPDGSVTDRNATLATYTPETRFWEKAEGDEYIVQIFGDTSVVIGRWTARGMNNGERFDYTARFLSIYVKQGGEWKMVAEQSAEIKIMDSPI